MGEPKERVRAMMIEVCWYLVEYEGFGGNARGLGCELEERLTMEAENDTTCREAAGGMLGIF